MHTLLIHQAFASPYEAGGTRHYEFARHAVKAGDRFTVVTSDLSYLSGRRATEKKNLVTKQNINHICVLRAYTYPSLHKSFVWRIVSFFSFMFTSIFTSYRASQIDLVMGTSPPIFQAISAWVVANIRLKPFLLEIRDLWPEFAIDMGILKNPILIKLSRWLECFLYNSASHILVNSPAYKKYLVEKGVLSDKITIIPNGADIYLFSPDLDGAAFRKAARLEDKFIVTYTGALGAANDIPTILHAAQILRNNEHIHFLFAGDGKERINLEKMAYELDLSNVTFLGSRPKIDIPMILAASDACVATLMDIQMFRTTYPNKVFDYMAAGIPTVLAIDGVIRKVIEAAGGGLFSPPGNPEVLAKTILHLANHPEESKQMGKQARDYVIRHFNREYHAQKFLELAQRVGGARF